MPQVAREELAEILFQEIGTYLPKIQTNLEVLQKEGENEELLYEIHRLFHNIKGAASQVRFLWLSRTAAVAEAFSEALFVQNLASDECLFFLAGVLGDIADFCELEDKSESAEKSMFSVTAGRFTSLSETKYCPTSIELPENLQKMISEAGTGENIPVATSRKGADTTSESCESCLIALRSVMPLLTKYTRFTAEIGTTRLPERILHPLSNMVGTLADCYFAEGLNDQHKLLTSFHEFINILIDKPFLYQQDSQNLLAEFVSYLDIILTLDPREAESSIARIQVSVSSFVDSLLDKDRKSISTEKDEVELNSDITTFDPEQAPNEDDVLGFLEAEEQNDSGLFDTGETDLFGADEQIEFAEEEDVAIYEDQLHSGLFDRDETDLFSEDEQLDIVAEEDEAASAEFSHSNLFDEDDADLFGDDDQLDVVGEEDEAVPEDLSHSNLFDEDGADLFGDDEQGVAAGEDDVPEPEDLSRSELFDADETDILAGDEQVETADEEAITASEYSSEQDELFEIFQAECEEHLQVIGQELTSLENSVRGEMPLTAERKDSVSSMRRAVHTLKGAAAMTGFDDLAGCAHSLEDMLDWLADKADTITSENVLVVAKAIDVIEALAENPQHGKDAVDSVVKLLQEHMASLSSSAQSSNDAATDTPEKEDVSTSRIDSDEPEAEKEPHQSEDYSGVKVIEEEAEDLESGGNIRVQLGDLDELAAIEGELVVARGSIEKQLDSLAQSLSDFGNTKETLQRKSQELEVGFEAQALYGFGTAGKSIGPADDVVAASSDPEFDPFELDQYSQLNLIIRSLNEISSDINALHTQMQTLHADMKGQVAKQQLAMGVMQEKLLRIRMTPLSSISRVLFRTARQTAASLGKDVRLTVTGEDVYMDRYVWSKTLDPLMHILRNCVDHGIEDGEKRIQAGKPETGQITIDAYQRSRNVVLQISDDGGGVDIETLRKKLLKDGLISPEEEYTDEDLLPFLFQPSLSTKKQISTISGRGVGLDVVVRNIKELRGTVQLSSNPGQGVTFLLTIPITLSVNRAIVVEIGEDVYAVPLQDVVEVKKYPASQIVNDPLPAVVWRDESVRVFDLAQLLSVRKVQSEGQPSQRLVLIVDTGTEHVAFQADRVVEQREIVIKDLGSHLTHVRGISGATLTGEGAVIPILNLIELANVESAVQATVISEEPIATEEKPIDILVIDDSISVRYTVTRLLETRAWNVVQAVDGLDALEQLENVTPDLIIVDIEMPRMNGYEFTATMRRDERHTSIPVVMLSSRASEKHRKKAFEIGVNHYVTKPYQDDAFIELLESTLKTG